MANRQIKTTNYFSHDSNARNDEKLVRLRMKHSAAGYGVYFMILERLREETEYMSVKDYNMIAFDLRVDAALVKSVVEDFGLFEFTEDGKCFFSDSFSRRMDIKDNLRRQRSQGGKTGMANRWNKKKTAAKSNTPPATAPKVAPIQNDDNDNCLNRFFSKDNKPNIEVLLMNFGMNPDDMPALRSLAEEVVNEWRLSGRQHNDYTDWSQHLISTMRIKRKDNQGKKTSVNDTPPKADDYKFGGGFGGADV